MPKFDYQTCKALELSSYVVSGAHLRAVRVFKAGVRAMVWPGGRWEVWRERDGKIYGDLVTDGMENGACRAAVEANEAAWKAEREPPAAGHGAGDLGI